MVLGKSSPKPRGFNGIQGWSVRTTYPKMNRTMLNTSREAVYCLQL